MKNSKLILLIFSGTILKQSHSVDTPIPLGDTTVTYPDDETTVSLPGGDKGANIIWNYGDDDTTSSTTSPQNIYPEVGGAMTKNKKYLKAQNNNQPVASTNDNVFILGEPTMFGSGCPEGSVDIISSTDGQTVTVLFSEYIAMTNNIDLNARVACNLAIPVQVIQGFAVGVFAVDYRGYAVVPSDPGSYSEFTAEYFFAGNPGPKTRKQYVDYVGEVNLTDEVKTGAVVYSECGSDTIFRINTAIRAMKANPGGEDVFIEVDSTDTTVKQSFRYHMASKACS